MSIIKSAKQKFYMELKKEEDQIALLWPGVTDLENTRFFELCQKYSDIALNAIKQREPGTCYLEGVLQFSDIDIAKKATQDYVTEWKIVDIDVLLSMIYNYHSSAVAEDDDRMTVVFVRPEHYDPHSWYMGSLFDFTSLPEDAWEKIAREVKEYICG